MMPLVSELNFMPNSTAWPSPLSTIEGVADAVHKLNDDGAGDGAGDGVEDSPTVVNDDVASAASALPARSFTPPAPPLTTSV
jgi:hypothetical protein